MWSGDSATWNDQTVRAGQISTGASYTYGCHGQLVGISHGVCR
jgi:hypothetical protein